MGGMRNGDRVASAARANLAQTGRAHIACAWRRSGTSRGAAEGHDTGQRLRDCGRFSVEPQTSLVTPSLAATVRVGSCFTPEVAGDAACGGTERRFSRSNRPAQRLLRRVMPTFVGAAAGKRPSRGKHETNYPYWIDVPRPRDHHQLRAGDRWG